MRYDFFSASTTGNNLSVDECSGELSIGCSDLNTNENCTINYQQDGLDFNKTVPPLNKFVLPMGVMQFQVIIKNESAIFQQAVNHSFNDNFSYNGEYNPIDMLIPRSEPNLEVILNIYLLLLP